MCLCLLLAMLFSCLQLALLFSCLRVGFALFLPAVGFALFLPAVGFALVLPAVGFALVILFSVIIQTVHFTQTVTASLRFRTLFTAPPLRSSRAARGLVVLSTTHSPPPRAARVEDVFPELVCSGSSLLSKQLQHCLSPRGLFTSPDDRP